jgi:hypothetical protein
MRAGAVTTTATTTTTPSLTSLCTRSRCTRSREPSTRRTYLQRSCAYRSRRPYWIWPHDPRLRHPGRSPPSLRAFHSLLPIGARAYRALVFVKMASTPSRRVPAQLPDARAHSASACALRSPRNAACQCSNALAPDAREAVLAMTRTMITTTPSSSTSPRDWTQAGSPPAFRLRSLARRYLPCPPGLAL